jgi:putative Holliday junction resolvase
MPGGPVLALDYGSRRIGMAVSDAEAEFAFPAGTLERQGLARDLDALAEVIRERGVTHLVVGLPLHLSGRAGPEAEAARSFAAALARATGLPVDLLDERWSTREAERAIRATQPRRGRRARERERVDAAAAALLLQTWLARAKAEAVRETPCR